MNILCYFIYIFNCDLEFSTVAWFCSAKKFKL